MKIPERASVVAPTVPTAVSQSVATLASGVDRALYRHGVTHCPSRGSLACVAQPVMHDNPDLLPYFVWKRRFQTRQPNFPARKRPRVGRRLWWCGDRRVTIFWAHLEQGGARCVGCRIS